MPEENLVVITDLDGTLLDASTYSHEEALPALRALEKKDIPLIFCSSKTRTEIEALRELLGNRHPFISENGGALYVPRGAFSYEIPNTRESGDLLVLELGLPYEALRAFLAGVQAEQPGRIRGFGDMTDEEVARLCNFSQERARLARQREYDEPLLATDVAALSRLGQQAEASGLRLVQGGRFHHLIGPNDKGLAVRRLRELYVRERGPVRIIGLGDSLNDLPLLREAEIPVLVQKPNGSYQAGVELPGLILAPGIGPIGWREAVLAVVDGPAAIRPGIIEKSK